VLPAVLDRVGFVVGILLRTQRWGLHCCYLRRRSLR
jgi:hypothetical protein